MAEWYYAFGIVIFSVDAESDIIFAPNCPQAISLAQANNTAKQ